MAVYGSAWRRLKRLQWITGVAFVTGASWWIMVFAFHALGNWMTSALGLTASLVAAIGVKLVEYFPCPHCGRSFGVKGWLGSYPILGFLPRRCVHCGLERPL